MELLVLKKENQKKSKYDCTLEGNPIHFKVEPIHNGVRGKFVQMVPLADTLPFPKDFLPPGVEGKKVEQVLAVYNFRLRWWEKLLGVRLENKLDRWAKMNYNVIQDMKRDRKRATEIANRIG